jgi:hypothetical protein
MTLSILILIFGIFALAQFAVSYCRTLLIAYGKAEISPRTRELASLTSHHPNPIDFARLMGFVRVAPDPGDDALEIGTITSYFHALRLARVISAPLSNRISRWMELELAKCAYFAAVTLDRRLPPILNR